MQHEMTSGGCVFRGVVDQPTMALGVTPDAVAYEMPRDEARSIVDAATDLAQRQGVARTRLPLLDHQITWLDLPQAQADLAEGAEAAFELPARQAFFEVTPREVTLVVATAAGRVESEVATVDDVADAFGLSAPAGAALVTQGERPRRRPGMR